MRVDELHGHRAFADGRRAALGRAGADVAGREHAGNVGLQQVVHVGRGAGEDEAVAVAADGIVEPFGTRQCAEEEDQEPVGEELAGLQRDRRKVPVLAVERRDLAPVANRDAVALELVDQVVGHRLAEIGAAMEEGDQRAAPGEPDGCLPGRVAAADDRDARARAELGLGRPGGIEDGQSLELVEAVDR